MSQGLLNIKIKISTYVKVTFKFFVVVATLVCFKCFYVGFIFILFLSLYILFIQSYV